MNWNRPSRSEVLQAIEIYNSVAYAGCDLPKTVQGRIELIAQASDEGLYEQTCFEPDRVSNARYAVRLGNQWYPHMKLMIERTPTGDGHLFRADTHDQHIRPQPGSKDAELFTQLAVKNQSAAEQIEQLWEQADLPTFKSFLKHDLARRRSESQAGSEKSG